MVALVPAFNKERYVTSELVQMLKELDYVTMFDDALRNLKYLEV